MDPLSRMIALMQPKAVAWRSLEVCGACTVLFPATEMVAFGQMLQGGATVELADGAERTIDAGDFILLPAPRPWRAHLRGGGPEVGLKDLFAAPEAGQGPDPTRFVAGAFEFAAPNAEWLASLAPAFLHVRGAEVEAGRLGGLLGMIADEALADRPGRSLMLDRLLEIVFLEAIRSGFSGVAQARPGLLAGLGDVRLSGALRLLHAAPQNAWTVNALARGAGMSRSSFAARFAEVLGVSPIDYLLALRMQIARAALTSAKEPMSRVAALAGYGSVSAFSTAFRRETGMTPSAFLRQASAFPRQGGEASGESAA